MGQIFFVTTPNGVTVDEDDVGSDEEVGKDDVGEDDEVGKDDHDNNG